MRSDCFFNDTATTEIYTLSLHDALPIWDRDAEREDVGVRGERVVRHPLVDEVVVLRRRLVPDEGVEQDERERAGGADDRSEEHTSELQSRQYLVCRLLLEKKTISRQPTR